MPKTIQKELNKVTKLIHPRSRKMAKLSKQSKRIASREKTKLVHHMKQNMLGEKLLWFRDHLPADVHRCTPQMVMDLIRLYLKRFDDELEQIALKHSVGNRKNRQHASREDIIKLTLLQEEEQFASCGLEMPDLLNPVQLEVLRTWNGELRFLQNFKLQRYSRKSLCSLEEKEENIATDGEECNSEARKDEDKSKLTEEQDSSERGKEKEENAVMDIDPVET
ncbi:translation machinery-associated protein 16 homolog [Anabrus simplex]|uniref:translation machinery-associated protein 16 homolog n=1 Tax=Anabrus simplex TaxID=316456 RepID=UPI0035A34B44